MSAKVTTAEARKNFSELINNVAYGQNSVIVTRRGKDLAAVIPIADLKKLEELEEKLDIIEAWEIKKQRGKNIKLADLKKELNL